MKINQLFEDGIITAYNTTVDVKPGETERQAAKLFPMNKDGKPKSMGVKGATPNQAFNLGLTENMSVTGTERKRLEKKKGIKIGTPEWFKHWFDLPYLREDITKQELLAKLKDQQRGRYIKAMLDAMHSLVQSKGEKHSIGNYAYEIAKTFGYNPKELEKMYRDTYNVPHDSMIRTEDVTQPQLNALEKAVDNVFGRIGIDVEFTRHFLDRANDERNGKPITIQELGKLFAKEYKRWGKPIAQMGPDTEAVMKDLESDINIPFALRWNGTELELIAKTVMRKKNFSTSNKQFPVENTQGSLAQKINWGGQNKPTKKPTAPKQQNMSWWQKLQQRVITSESDVPLGKYLFHVAYASGLTGMLRDGHLGEPDEYFSMTADPKYVVSGNPEVQIVIDTAKVSKMETFEKYVDDWESTPGAGDWAKGGKGDFESEYRVEETIPWDYVVAVKILKSKATKEIIQLAKQRGVKLIGKDNNVTEGYKLHLERDDDLMVLHIVDTKSGKRTEVRGKPGYERGNYDANDKLHKLLDTVGKSANIAELINGEVVTINPKHPDAERAKKATDVAYNENFADGKINEVLDKPAAYTWSKDQFGFPTATAKELGLNIHFDGRNEPAWEVSFNRKQKNGSVVMNRPTGQGKEFQVFATVKAAILDFMNKYPDTVTLVLDARKDGGKDDQGRVSLYRRMMKQYANKLGWEYDEFDQGGMVTFEISSNPRTDENFADGKKKGKSRPGRVKRAGASCNGSVTELRKRAKNSSGEKAKMYRWCANMKSGKNK